MMNMYRLLLGSFLLCTSSLAFALQNVTFCVWDPVGRNGPVMTFYSDVIPTAQKWGLNIRFEPYTDERVAAKEFKAGFCDAAVLTSILSRQFVKFAGTMDAVGAIDSQEGLELAIATFARERAGNLMVQGNYEVVTTFPVGSMFAFVKDRSMDTIEDFAGKKMSILNGDPQMQKFADLAGASKVNTTLANFAGQFNSGALDIVIMPALAYNTFELYHGLGERGGIINYRLYYGMLQTIAKRDKFPKDFGKKMRSYMLTRMQAIHKMVADAEDEIPTKYWINTSQSVKDDIEQFSQRVRQDLATETVNSSTALKLFWKIRCRLDRSRGECKEFPAELNRLAHEESNQLHKSETLNIAERQNKSRAKPSKSVTPKLTTASRKTSGSASAIKELREKNQSLARQLASVKSERGKLKAELNILRSKHTNLEIANNKLELAYNDLIRKQEATSATLAQNTAQQLDSAALAQEKVALENARKALEMDQLTLEQGQRLLSQEKIEIKQIREQLMAEVAKKSKSSSKRAKDEDLGDILARAELVETEGGFVSQEPSAAGDPLVVEEAYASAQGANSKPQWWQYIFFWTL